MNKIADIRNLLDVYALDGYLIPIYNEFQSSYCPEHLKRLEYICGFTGSNGLLVVLKERSLFFTDSRYILQAQSQLPSECEVFDISDMNLQSTGAIGYDERLFTYSQLSRLNIPKLTAVADNLVDIVMQSDASVQKSLQISKVWLYPNEIVGETAAEKLHWFRCWLRDMKLSAYFIADMPSVAWLLNIRAMDVPNNPLLLCYAMVTDTKCIVFTDNTSLDDVLSELDSVDRLPVDKAKQYLADLLSQNCVVAYDKQHTPIVYAKVIGLDTNVVNPCILKKACKLPSEIEGFDKIHIQDAVAVIEFLSDINHINDLSKCSEVDLVERLRSYRQMNKNYICDSFETICAFGPNASIIHYNPKVSEITYINSSGLLLIDSGAHYVGGTTDVTRTIWVGNDKRKIQKYIYYYTKILKGHIALAMARFKYGASGSNLDILARQYLFAECLDYSHGTGHGVGNCLSVHEGPIGISPKYDEPLDVGMVVSNEPGFYVDNKFGIRIENLQYIRNVDMSERSKTSQTQAISKGVRWMEFVQLTLIPYSRELIDLSQLDAKEMEFLKSYYASIRQKLEHFLTPKARMWLQQELDIFDGYF